MEAILNREVILDKGLCRLFCALTFILLTGFGAFVRVPLPFTPVPITLQTFFVLLSGALMGSSLGAFTQLGYIFLGAAGIQVFSGVGSGSMYLLGPTGGYLFGFVLAAFWLGRFIKYSGDNLLLTVIMFCMADFILLSCGVLWLKILFGYSFTKLFFIGLVPFIPGDLVKSFIAAVIYLRLKNRMQEVI